MEVEELFKVSFEFIELVSLAASERSPAALLEIVVASRASLLRFRRVAGGCCLMDAAAARPILEAGS